MKVRLARQSFLGPNSSQILDGTRAAIIGLCGGGSHLCQQLAHLGVGNFQIFDPDHVEESNLNRMVGATAEDARLRTLKTDVMCRVIRGINPEAAVTAVGRKWQEQAELLRDSDVIFACVDSFSEREQLERAARRYLVPYIDVGMDVCEVDDGHSVGGQVALSLPGGLCLRCLGIITDQRLAQEAAKYGAAGDRPQVV